MYAGGSNEDDIHGSSTGNEYDDEQAALQLFYIDRTGDDSLLAVKDKVRQDEVPESQTIVPAENYIAISDKYIGSKKGKRKIKKAAVPRVKKDDSEVLQDYIDNCDPILQLDIVKHLDGESEGSDFLQDGRIVYDDILNSGSSLDNSSDYDSEEENAAILGIKLRQTHVFDSDDEEDFIKQNYQGNRGCWDESFDYQKALEEASFLKQVNGDFSSSGDDDLEDVGETSKKQRRKHRKEGKREIKKAQKNNEMKLKGDSALLQNALKSQTKTATVISKDVMSFLRKTNAEIYCFVQDPRKQETNLTLMPETVRNMVKTIAISYGLKLLKRGKGANRRIVIYRTHTTYTPPNWKLLPSIAASTLRPNKVKGIGKQQQKIKGALARKGKQGQKGPKNIKKPVIVIDDARPKIGQAVGHGATPVSECNLGHRMMKLMGWNPGESLGASNGGITDPLKVIIRKKKTGLGMA